MKKPHNKLRKSTRKEPIADPEAYSELPFISYRLQGLGWALTHHNVHAAPSSDAIHGLGLLIEESGLEIYEIYRKLDEANVTKQGENHGDT